MGTRTPHPPDLPPDFSPGADLYRVLVENIDLGVTLVSTDYRVLMTNQAFGRLFQREPKSFEGLRCFEQFEKRSEQCAHCPGAIALATGQAARAETEAVRDDGSRFPVLVQAFPVMDSEGVPVAFIEVVQDITQRRRDEQELRQFKTMFDQAGYGAAAADMSGHVTYVNQAMAQMHGYTREELLGRHLSVFHSEDQLPRVRELVQQLHQAGHVLGAEVWHARRDGQAFPTLMSATVIHDQNGVPVMTAATTIDNTARFQAEELLRIERELGAALSQVDTLGAALDCVLDHVLRIEGIDCGGIYLYDEARGAFVLKAHRNLSAEFIAAVREVGTHIAEVGAILNGHPLAWHHDHSIWCELPLSREGVCSTVSIPVLHLGRVVAALNLASRTLEELPAPTRHAVEAIGARLGGTIVRVRAEEQRAAEEARYRLLADYSTDMISRVSPDGVFLYVSPACRQILGFEPADLVGHNVYEFFPPEDEPALRVHHERVLHGPAPITFACRMRRRDGSLVWVEATARARLDAQTGRVLDIIGVNRDITARRQSLQALQEREQMFRTLAETVPACITLTQDSVVKYVSSAVCKLTGYSAEELLGTHPWDYAHPDMRDQIRQQLTRRTAGLPAPMRYEMCIRAKDGRELWLDQSIAVLDYEGKRTILGAALDITDRKQTERALQQHRDQLAHVARVSTLGQMASALAHELSQPLSAILYYARAALTGDRAASASPDPSLAALRRVMTQAERASAIIRGLKSFVRKTHPQQGPADINTIVHDALTIAQAEARAQKTPIQVELADSLPAVAVDPVLIEQVILNLVRNAVDAIADLPAKRRAILVRTDLGPGGAVCVSVEDHGPGLSPEAAARLGEPFFTTKPDGMGLGWSISRSIIEAHEGTLWTQDAPGGGTIAGFSLPVPEPPGEQP